MSQNSNEAPQPTSARRSLADLKKQLEKAEPVYVDSQGHLTTEHEEAIREKTGGAPNRTTVKPSRWF